MIRFFYAQIIVNSDATNEISSNVVFEMITQIVIFSAFVYHTELLKVIQIKNLVEKITSFQSIDNGIIIAAIISES